MSKLADKIADHMLLGSVYDNIMKKTKYRQEKLSFNYNVMMAQKHRMLYYKRLKKEFYSKCTARRPWEKEEKTQNPDTIWVLWLQGFDQAPELVRVCLESLRKALPEKKIVELTEDNLSDYLDLPQDLVDKWKKGIIGPAHFSDLIRLEVLIRYGGYWVDSTVLCTNRSIFDQIQDQPLFMYSFYYFDFNPEIMELNNWFIYSTSNNNMLCLERAFLYAYWRKYNRPLSYWIFHIFMTMVTEYYPEDYQAMPIVSQASNHILATYIYQDAFDQKKYDLLKSYEGIHKLSTRFLPEKINRPGSFYDVLIRKKQY